MAEDASTTPDADADADKDADKGADKGTTPDKPTDEGKAPKWEGEYDADRAARLVSNLRKEKDDLAAEVKSLRDSVTEKGGSEKTLQDRLAALEDELATSKRDLLVAKVAKAHSIPEDLADMLTGKSEEELTAQAERLAAHVKKPADDVPTKPKPRLTPGTGAETVEDDFDPKKVAASVRRR